MSGSDSKRFYTYLHYRLNTMQVFYVGKGTGRRAHEWRGRNKYWKSVAASCGYKVEIAAEWKTEAEAIAHEIFLIDTLKSLGIRLANMTSGGDGGPGLSPSQETRMKLSDAHRKSWASDETRRRRLAGIRSDECRKKISESVKARWTEGAYPTAKPVLCHQNSVTYESTKQAALALGVPQSKVSRICNGKLKQTHGYTFSFTEPQVPA